MGSCLQAFQRPAFIQLLLLAWQKMAYWPPLLGLAKVDMRVALRKQVAEPEVYPEGGQIAEEAVYLIAGVHLLRNVVMEVDRPRQQKVN